MLCHVVTCLPRVIQRYNLFFFLMMRRPPRSTLDRSSAASDVYKRQHHGDAQAIFHVVIEHRAEDDVRVVRGELADGVHAVSYTHLRAHETVLDLVCRLLLEKKKHTRTQLTD